MITYMTTSQLCKLLQALPENTPIKLFDRKQYLDDGFQTINAFVPVDEILVMPDGCVVLNSTWTGIEFGDEEDC